MFQFVGWYVVLPAVGLSIAAAVVTLILRRIFFRRRRAAD